MLLVITKRPRYWNGLDGEHMVVPQFCTLSLGKSQQKATSILVPMLGSHRVLCLRVRLRLLNIVYFRIVQSSRAAVAPKSRASGNYFILISTNGVPEVE